MVVWLRPECVLAIVTSLHFFSQLVSSKTYDKFWCATEEGQHQLSCPDETALLTDVTIRKVYRLTQTCAPDIHSDYLIHCQELIDGSSCEGNKTCFVQVSSRNYLQCGEKSYAPTYFFVKYTCTQIYTMCQDTDPIRNTLYGFIVSPGYPHPMADNLICSINIEAGPSMYIELAPIHINLQDAFKCRSEYLEVFGYINPLMNTSHSSDMSSNKNSKDIWKSYYTWCGAEQSANNPTPNARYLISSNSLYMSLHTAKSKKPRYFKIRYKVVPSIARSQYDPEGVALDVVSDSSTYSSLTTTTIQSTTIAMPTVQSSSIKSVNGTITKRTMKKEIIIGIIAGVVVFVIAILVGIGIFLFLKKRRLSTNTASASKPATPASANNAGKKNIPSTTAANSMALKGNTKPIDKAPLIEHTTTTPAPSAAKRKLIPERTVQISDLHNSRFKAVSGTTTAPASTVAKDTSTTGSEGVTTSSAPKPALTAADSGIYGADLSDDAQPVKKSVPPAEPPRIYGADLPDKSDSTPPVTIVVNPFSEHSNSVPSSSSPAVLPTTADNTTTTNTTTTTTTTATDETTPVNVIPNKSLFEQLQEEKEVLLNPHVNEKHFDDTVKSAYSHLIDATISENEGTIGGGSVTSSASQSRRTSNVRQPLLSHETNNVELGQRKTTQFNPLHMILKKDANKYYTTEYI